MSDISERGLPCDLNAETAVLSAMMIDNYSVSKGIEIIREEQFYKTAHRIIFKSITELFNDNIEVDIITLLDKLTTTGNLDKVGGKAFINELSDVVLSSANIEYHAKIVLEKALLRDLIITSNKIIKTCYDSEKTAADTVDWAEHEIFKIAEMPNKKTFTRLSNLIPDTMQHIENVASNPSALLGIPSGFRALDSIIGGFRKGQLVIIAARPGMGKSSFALNIAYNAAKYHDKKVGIFTLEMSNDEVLMRLLSSASGVEMSSMLKGTGLDQEKLVALTEKAIELESKDIYVDDTGFTTVMDIKAKTRRLKAELKGLDLIIIDYIQLMSARKSSENRQQEISEISRGLKVLAKDLEVPVIALSQLNRSLESREKDKKPRLSDLRESGAIEQDADMVMFIYRDEYYTKQESEKKGIAEIIIAKNRHGSLDNIELKFVGSATRFEDLDGFI
jgi:replicative DNA helicase